jgi:endo-1,4-beta-xylanase
MYAELDCPIHITELHQPAWEHEIEGGWRTGMWTPEAQAECIEQMYRQFFGHPSVVSINYWGFSDRNIWMPGGGLIDEEYRPKPSFKMLKNLIKGEWMTAPFTALTDENGEVAFRGFYGQYEVTRRLPGQKHPTRNLHLAENQENIFTFIE